jgi:hypothetical protein
MAIYYALILFPSLLLIGLRKKQLELNKILWFIFFIFFLIVIGLRDEVGADWANYIRHYDDSNSIILIDAFFFKDFGYTVLNWLVNKVGGGIYLVNLICASIVLWCLISFSKREPFPWLYVSVAVLFYIIIIGMSLSRQAIALGFFLLAIRATLDKSSFAFVSYIILATFFHKTAILLIPLYSIINLKGKKAILAGFFIISLTGGFIYFSGIFDGFAYYIEQEWQSEGAFSRSIYLALPAVLFFVLRNKLIISNNERNLLLLFSTLSVLSLLAFFLPLTILDRFLLYLMPFPPMVYCRLMLLLRKSEFKMLFAFIVIFGHLVILYIWLNFSNNSIAWIPYKNILFN